jgi:endoglucanase
MLKRYLLILLFSILSGTAYAKAANSEPCENCRGITNDNAAYYFVHTDIASEGAQCINHQCLPLLAPNGGTQYLVLNSRVWGGNIGYNICRGTQNLDCPNYIGHIRFAISPTSNVATCSFNDSDYSCIQSWDATRQTLNVKINYTLPAPRQFPPATLQYRGINMAGAEYGLRTDLRFIPTGTRISPFAQAGMNTLRIPIRWEYLTDTPDGSINNAYAAEIKALVSNLLNNSNGAYTVILDLHNYMRWCPDSRADGCSTLVTKKEMHHIWAQLAVYFKELADTPTGRTHLMFGIMNEPHTMETQLGFELNMEGIKAIRAQGLINKVLLDGNQWSGLHSWVAINGDTFTDANIKAAVPNVGDYAIDVHQYFDQDFSGTHETCLPKDQFLHQLNFEGFKTWVHSNQAKVIVTEFGAADNAQCREDMNAFLELMDENVYTPDMGGFIGWTAWQAAPFNSTFNGLQPGGIAYGLMTHVFAGYLTPLHPHAAHRHLFTKK